MHRVPVRLKEPWVGPGMVNWPPIPTLDRIDWATSRLGRRDRGGPARCPSSSGTTVHDSIRSVQGQAVRSTYSDRLHCHSPEHHLPIPPLKAKAIQKISLGETSCRSLHARGCSMKSRVCTSAGLSDLPSDLALFGLSTPRHNTTMTDAAINLHSVVEITHEVASDGRVWRNYPLRIGPRVARRS